MSPQPHDARPADGRILGRDPQFLVASRDGIGAAALVERLGRHGDVELVKVLAESDGAEAVAVVRMAADHSLLQRAAEARLAIEPDSPLIAAALPRRAGPAMAGAGAGAGFTVAIEVRGDHDQPVAGAEIDLWGAVGSASAVTGGDGKASLTLAGETPDSVRGLLVTPRQGYWSRRIDEPQLAPDRGAIIDLTPLPAQAVSGWGATALGLDRLPEEWRGQGLRLAVIGGGVATSHPRLGGIRHGADFTGRAGGWTQDESGQATAVAGLLVAREDGGDVRGILPDAELHICKVVPGGRCSDLIAALDYCVDHEIDIVTLAAGSARDSQLVERRIRLAKRHGIAVVAAVGSDGGPVQYPARSANVLAVAAIGKVGEVPADSANAGWSEGEEVSAEGFFPPKFSAAGDEVDLCAPGIGILSCQAPDGVAAFDGTALAAAYAAALAAQVLAHHPTLRRHRRDGARVESVFRLIKDSARPLAAGDAMGSDTAVSGAGLPNAVFATGLEPGPGGTGAEAVAALRRILTVLAPEASGAAGGTAVESDLDQLHAAMANAGLAEAGLGRGVERGPVRLGPSQAAELAPNLNDLRMSMALAGLSLPQ